MPLCDANDPVHNGITAVPGYALGIPATVGQAECPYEALFGRPRCISEGVGCNANNDRTSQQQHLVACRQCGSCHRLPSTLFDSRVSLHSQNVRGVGKERRRNIQEFWPSRSAMQWHCGLRLFFKTIYSNTVHTDYCT